MHLVLCTDIVCGRNTIDHYLYQGIDINDDEGYYLKLAVIHGHLHIVKHLIKKGIDINSRNSYNLIAAIENNHTKIGKYLIEQGIRVYPELVYISSKYNNLDILKLLIKKNIDYNIERCIDIAVAMGNIRIVRYFLSKHHSYINNTIMNLTIVAAGIGCLSLVKYFLDLSPGASTLEIVVLKAMYGSCRNSKLNILKYLIKYYIHYMSPDDLNIYYIHSTNNNCSVDILKQLNKTKKINCHRKALEIYTESTYTTLTYYLLKLCTIDDINNAFIKVNNLDNANILLNNGADIHYLEEKALKNAITNNNIDLASFLIDKGANVNINHEEPLRLAINSDVSYDIIELLVDNGANIDIAADIIISEHEPDIASISKLTAFYDNQYLYETEVTDTECGICLTDLQDKDSLFRCYTCRHTVHRFCQKKWKGKCIYCRN